MTVNLQAYQAYPQDGALRMNLSLSRESLLGRVNQNLNDVGYCYVVATIEYEEGRLYQSGSGPNLQGGLITLCSCKHLMRTYLNTDQWRAKWVAGLTSSRYFGGRNALFYLMKVSHAFASHEELWHSEFVPEMTKQAKAANLDRFGDIYQPNSEFRNPFDPYSYYPPCKNHVHCEPGDWHKDTRYMEKGKRPALLLGDPDHSFVWNRPIIFSPIKPRRASPRMTVAELLGMA